MQEFNQELAGQPDRDDKIAAICDQLLAVFGADACDVIGRQIEAAGDGEGLATWNAVWDRLCGPAARPVLSE